MKSVYKLIYALIFLNVILSAYFLLQKDIRFDVDVSRDFFLIKEIVTEKPFTLIGSHTSVAGVFHGPLWYYLNAPAFFVSSGNPVFIGWFWWGLSILTLVIFFYVTKKLFNKLTASLATLLLSANSIINPIYGLKMFFPPYGAVVLSPVFFYLFIKYINSQNVKYLLGALFILGLIIQFEMAFGVPILILMFIFLIFFLTGKKLLKHFLAFLVIALPLSTFIFFELRHNFLQTLSLVRYIESELGRHQFNFLTILTEKIRGIFPETFFHLIQDNIYLSWIYSILFLILIFAVKMKSSSKLIYLIFLYFYLGYWFLHLSLKPLWPSYYWPLLPLIIMLYVGFINYLPKKIFLLIFLPLLFWNMYIGVSYIKDFKQDIKERGKNSWAFHKLIADTIYQNAESDFGYFIFTPERWVYQSWYALDFTQRYYHQKKSYPFKKQKITYLILVDTPKYYPEPVTQGWRITDLKILSEPKEIKNIDVAQIQKYYLTDEEIKLGVNPLLLNSTFFR